MCLFILQYCLLDVGKNTENKSLTYPDEHTLIRVKIKWKRKKNTTLFQNIIENLERGKIDIP